MGCVYKKLKGGRDLGWYAAFVDADGRRHHVATKQTTNEAKVRRGLVGVPETRAVSTVAELAERWLAARPGPKADKRRHTARMCLQRVLPNLGGVPASKLTAAQVERLVAQLGVAEQHFPLVSVCTPGRALRQIGARRGRPKPTVQCPWPAKLRDKVLRSLRRLEALASDSEPVLFADEVDLHLNPKVGLDWCNRGTQRELLTPGQNKKHYLAGALDSRSRRFLFVDGPKKNSLLFCALLDLLCAPYPEANTIHLILDNYGIHTSRLVHKKLAALDGKITLHFLPPCCPDENRIEREGQELHANVTRNHRCKSLLTLLMYVYLYLAHRNQKATAGATGSLRYPVAA